MLHSAACYVWFATGTTTGCLLHGTIYTVMYTYMSLHSEHELSLLTGLMAVLKTFHSSSSVW